MQVQHLGSLSGKGDGPDQFQVRLVGVAVDDQDRVFALGDREIKRFSAEGKLEQRIELRDAPWSLALDGDSLWVGMQGAIDKLDAEGNLQTSIDEPERLGLITALAVQGEVLLAADATNRTIHRFVGGVWQGEVGKEVNTRGFMLPNGVLDLSLDAEGKSIVVAHSQKHRVERYDLDGELTHKFGRFGMVQPGDFGGCCNPTNITALPAQRIAVSEKAPPCVKVFTAEGEFLAKSADGVFSDETKNIDLAADSRGRLYATVMQNCTIEIFQLQQEV